MCLDVSHNAFCGAYSAFNRFRQAVAWTAGGIHPPFWLDDERTAARFAELEVEEPNPDYWYMPDSLSAETNPGLWVFLSHSDCDGEISPEDCAKVADDLTPLLDKINDFGPAGPHNDRNGGLRGTLQRFIDGCRAAAGAGEALEFH